MPSHEYGKTKELEYYDFDLGFKVTASMSAYHRAELIITI